MSTNAKNIIRPEFLKNFTKNVKERLILLEKGNSNLINVSKFIPEINQYANEIIQYLNLIITDRQLPYINLQPNYGTVYDNRIRVFLHNDKTDVLFEQEIKERVEKETQSSHVLDILIAMGFKKITISNLSCDAELVVDEELLYIAIIDIILDIIMFNSYSFLKNMSIDDKKKFSKQKYDYYIKKQLPCFYECSTEKMLYYSLAFSARDSEGYLDYDLYLKHWQDFLKEYYPGFSHKEKSIREQLKEHVDYEELPKSLNSKFNEYDIGAYLLLRTNKDRTENLHPFLCNLFGIKKYKKGKIKIVPISEFEIYKPLMENLDISAFKVVKWEK